MKKIYLSIPHVSPNLEIFCQNEKIMEYAYNMFYPYAGKYPDTSREYKKIHFDKNEEEEFRGDDACKQEGVRKRIIPCIEDYLLLNSVLEKGYLMLHGGGAVYNESAFAFLANSGVGKSTLITHLCMNGFEYITDDRLLIDTNAKEVIPYVKTVMLRPEGRKILCEQYNHRFHTTVYRYGKIDREFYFPEHCRRKNTKLKNIFILERKEGYCISREKIKNSEKLKELLKYSLSIQSNKHISDFINLCSLEIERIYYSDLNAFSDFLRNMVI